MRYLTLARERLEKRDQPYRKHVTNRATLSDKTGTTYTWAIWNVCCPFVALTIAARHITEENVHS